MTLSLKRINAQIEDGLLDDIEKNGDAESHIGLFSHLRGNGFNLEELFKVTMTRKFGADDYKKIATKVGYGWLGPLPENAHSKTLWKCTNGHTWDAPYSALKSGNLCRICRNENNGNRTRLKPQAYEALARERGWIWIGPQVNSIEIKTCWECENGHKVKIDYEHLKRGRGCTACSNRTQKTKEDYFALARHMQIYWLGTEVLSTNAKTLWRCEKRHKWEASYNAVAASSGCPICILKKEHNRKYLIRLAEELGFEWLGFDSSDDVKISRWRCKTGHFWKSTALHLSTIKACNRCTKLQADAKLRFGPNEYHGLAKDRNIAWIGGQIINTTKKTSWRCSLGHEWMATYAVIKQLGECPVCSKEKRLAEKPLLNTFCISLASARGIFWMGKSVQRKKDSTTWECSLGHKWEAVVSEVQKGSGCPYCARASNANLARKSASDYHALAQRKGINWIGQVVLKTSMKTEWECTSGHSWFAQYHNISNGSGCPKCSRMEYGNKRKYTADKYHQVAIEKGLKWVGATILTTSDKTDWICSSGHQIRATYSAIKSGKGCSVCNQDTRALALKEQKLSKPSKKKETSKKPIDLSFMRAKRRRTTEDYHCLAQHCSIVWVSPEVSTTHTKTKWQCSCGTNFDASFLKIMQGRRCPACSRKEQNLRRRHTPESYHKMAERSSFSWLGPEVLNNKEKTKWRCLSGHEWMACYHSLDSGQGCPECGKKSASQKTRLKSTAYEDLARSRGFTWLGPEVSNAVTKTNWRCQLGHEWAAQYNNIHSGSGCRECAKTRIGAQLRNQDADYEQAASRAGFIWLGPSVANSREKTKWRCEKLHEWSAPLSSIKRGHGCRKCILESSANARRLHLQSYEECALRNGFVWIGPEVANTSAKTGWECSEGYSWQANYGHINSGRGCPKCGKLSAVKKTQLSDEEYRKIASEKKVLWLGPSVQNIHALTQWQCHVGHEWQASYRAIKKMARCPQCSDVVAGKKTSAPQREICEMLDGHLNYKVGPYSIDIALITKTERIAIEYDAWFWHARKGLTDKRRDSYLLKKGWRILRIKANKNVPERANLEKHIDLLKAGMAQSEIVLSDWGIGKVWSRGEN